LLVRRRQWKPQLSEAVGAEVVDTDSLRHLGKDAVPGKMAEDDEREPRGHSTGPEADDRVLEAAPLKFAPPDDRLADLVGAPGRPREKDIPRQQAVYLPLGRRELHVEHIAQVQSAPGDVRSPYVLGRVLARPVLGRALPSEADLADLPDRGPGPASRQRW